MPELRPMERQFTRQAHVTPQSLAHPALTLTKFDAERHYAAVSDITIRDIPETAKLVLVVGPNGSGKSSLFDALLQWYRIGSQIGAHRDDKYYRKGGGLPINWGEAVKVVLAGHAALVKGSLYIRTAYRNDPDFDVTGFGRLNAPSEGSRVSRTIENDAAVAENYQRLTHDTMAAVYNTDNDAKSVMELRQELIGEIQASMQAVFEDLVLNNISDPLGQGSFTFAKGSSTSYHYKNLSGGEKAAFDLLLDIHVKKKYFSDAIYCLDEIETHLHTRVQGKLSRELFRIIPERSQLWLTTHSLGVLRAAQELASEYPDTVCVLDFDGVEPDSPTVIRPSSLGRIVWAKLLSIALDDLTDRLAPAIVIVCEGSSAGNVRRDFDAEIYNRILGSERQDVLFVSGGSSTQVAVHGISVKQTLKSIIPAARLVTLVDRDDRSEQEVAGIMKAGGLVLSKRNLESFLLAEDVVAALAVQSGLPDMVEPALAIRAESIRKSVSRGNADDDLKSAAGEIYTGLKKLLNLQKCGNNTDAFLRDTMAPLVKSPLLSFAELRVCVIESL